MLYIYSQFRLFLGCALEALLLEKFQLTIFGHRNQYRCILGSVCVVLLSYLYQPFISWYISDSVR